jgi:hypothetical protein
MHLIIDLPLATTFDPNGYSWYGSSEILSQKINVMKYFRNNTKIKF